MANVRAASCFQEPACPQGRTSSSASPYPPQVSEGDRSSLVLLDLDSPKLPQLLPVDSKAVPANQADYPIICSNLKIKTDKEKIFREQRQAEHIKLLSDLYLSNGFMAFNNLKRNIMFFNTLF